MASSRPSRNGTVGLKPIRFLAKVHQKWRGKKSGLDSLPDSHSLFGTGSVFMADRPGGGKIFGTNSRNYYVNATSYSLCSPLPYEQKAEAIA